MLILTELVTFAGTDDQDLRFESSATKDALVVDSEVSLRCL